MQPLPGFRDLYPGDFARRNYLTGRWRETARRYGFVEFDGPTLEPTDLYRKKNSGGESWASFTSSPTRGSAMSPCVPRSLQPSPA